MPVLVDISTLYKCLPDGGQAEVHPVTDAAVAWKEGRIEWAGPASELPVTFEKESRLSAGGNVVIPGLVDCHTHLAFGGWRAAEFEKRLKGVSYLDIARQGGGIRKTMVQTREATPRDLRNHSLTVLRKMVALGVTTVECKSGYGLSADAERKQLELYRQLREIQPVDIVSTFLGAHIVPPEFTADRMAYVDLLCNELIPEFAGAGLAEFCDVFVEETAFSREEALRILETGKQYGLRPKLHVDQLYDGDGAALAAEVTAISADHLEYTGDEGIRRMADAGVVGVCLPIATLYLGQQSMKVRKFVDAGIPVAVATDFNPGSAPSFHLPLAMMLSCTMNGLTPAEALKGATCYAAAAIGRDGECGSIEPGKRADLAVLEVPDINHWMYQFEANVCTETYIRGVSQKPVSAAGYPEIQL